MRAGLSSEPGFGLRACQNFSTNAARSASLVSALQAAVSWAVMIHFTGPFAQCSSGLSSVFGGAWNSLVSLGERE